MFPSFCPARAFAPIAFLRLAVIAAALLGFSATAFAQLSIGLTNLGTPSFSTVGALLTSTFTVSNGGPTTVTSVTVTDSRETNIICPTPVIPAGSFVTCTGSYRTTASDIPGGATDSAKVTACGGGFCQSINVGTTFTSTYVAPPSITVSETLSPATFTTAGATISETFLVTNTSAITGIGQNDFGTVRIADNRGSTVTCPSLALAEGASMKCTGSFSTTAADVSNGSASDYGTVSADTNYGGSIQVTSATVQTSYSGGSLSLTDTTAVNNFTAVGQKVSSTFKVSNTGSTTISGLLLTDNRESNITCPATSLVAGASMTCAGSYSTTSADASSRYAVDQASVTGATAAGATVTAKASATETYAPQPSATLKEKAKPTSFSAAGQTITTTFTVTNTGPLALAVAMFKDTRESNISCQSLPIAVGASTTCTGSYQTTAADVAAGAAADSATLNTGTVDQIVTLTSSATVPYAAPSAGSPSLSLTDTANPTSFTAAGQTIASTFKVKNTGNVAISSLSVTDSRESNVTCKATTLAAGASTTCTGAYTTTAADVSTGSASDSASANGAPASGALSAATASASVTFAAKPAGAISATEIVSPAQFTAAGQAIAISISVVNTGAATLSSLGVTDTRATIACSPTTLAAKATATCTGSYVATAADVAAGAAADAATIAAVASSGAVSAQTSGKVGYAAPTPMVSVAQTQSDIRGFLTQRADLMMSNEPERGRILSRMSTSALFGGDGSTGSGSAPYTLSSSGTDGTGSLTFASSLAGGTGGAGVRGWDVWTEAHAGVFQDDGALGGARGNYFVGYVGADYLVTPAVLFGAVVEIDSLSQSSTDPESGQRVRASGDGWMVGPYVGLHVLPHLYFDARGAWGESNDRLDPIGTFTDSYATSRGLGEARLTGDWAFGGWQFAPTARVTFFGERQNPFVDAQGLAVPSQYVATAQTAFGPQFSYRFALPSELVVEPKFSLEGVWDFQRAVTPIDIGPEVPATLRGRVEAGAQVKTKAGLSFSASLAYDGLGTPQYHDVEGRLTLNVPLP